jgi:hypothetical protein
VAVGFLVAAEKTTETGTRGEWTSILVYVCAIKTSKIVITMSTLYLIHKCLFAVYDACNRVVNKKTIRNRSYIPIDGLVVGDIDGYDDGPTVGTVEIYDG